VNYQDAADYYAEESARAFGRTYIRPHKRGGKFVKGHYRTIDVLPDAEWRKRPPPVYPRIVLAPALSATGVVQSAARALARLVEEGEGVEEAEGIRRGQRVRVGRKVRGGHPRPGPTGTVEKILPGTGRSFPDIIYKVKPDDGKEPLYLVRAALTPITEPGPQYPPLATPGQETQAGAFVWPLVG
jgi:hypothetical protein